MLELVRTEPPPLPGVHAAASAPQPEARPKQEIVDGRLTLSTDQRNLLQERLADANSTVQCYRGDLVELTRTPPITPDRAGPDRAGDESSVFNAPTRILANGSALDRQVEGAWEKDGPGAAGRAAAVHQSPRRAGSLHRRSLFAGLCVATLAVCFVGGQFLGEHLVAGSRPRTATSAMSQTAGTRPALHRTAPASEVVAQKAPPAAAPGAAAAAALAVPAAPAVAAAPAVPETAPPPSPEPPAAALAAKPQPGGADVPTEAAASEEPAPVFVQTEPEMRTVIHERAPRVGRASAHRTRPHAPPRHRRTQPRHSQSAAKDAAPSANADLLDSVIPEAAGSEKDSLLDLTPLEHGDEPGAAPAPPRKR